MSENESTGDDGGVEVGSKNKRVCTLSEYYEKTKVTKRMKVCIVSMYFCCCSRN